MSSWPALSAAALAIWLVLKRLASTIPSWICRACHAALAFLLYSGFLYLLKWDPLWTWIPPVGFESRNRAEGFLILVSTLVWLITTLRILFRGFRFPSSRSGSGGIANDGRRHLSLTDLALLYLFMRK